jgi:glutathione S-transferase
MPIIKYFYAPGACSMAGHILLLESGLPFEAVCPADVRTSPLPEDFRRINPKMRVPVICVDGETITEVPAILTIIASFVPEQQYLGRTTLETVRAYEWMNWLSGTLHAVAFKAIFRPLQFSTEPAAAEAIAARGREAVKEGLDHIESRLVGLYAVGQAFSAVDPYLFVFYRWANGVGFDMKTQYPKYTALVQNLVGRESVQTALKVEGIESTL